jgi:hypothetical protein
VEKSMNPADDRRPALSLRDVRDVRDDARALPRRRVLELVRSAMLVPIGVGTFGIVATGCASILGEEDLDAYFKLAPDKNGDFFGWSEITITGADPKEDDAILKQVLLETLDGDDLTFITDVIAEAVKGEERTILAEGSDFPKGETIAPLELVHDGGVAEFFEGETIRIEWTGKADPAYPYPAGGMRINVRIQVEVV